MEKGIVLFWSLAAAIVAAAGFAVFDQAPAPTAVLSPVVDTPARADALRLAPPPGHVVAANPPGRAADLALIRNAEQAWEARIDAYRHQLRLAEARQLAPQELALVRQQLLDAHFNAEEQGRLAAYLPPAAPTLTRQ